MTADHPGALVISLDFELHWGMRDTTRPEGAVADNLRASRPVVGDLARTFAERGIRATWATVGMLFASTRSELEAYLPSVRPAYERRELDPYAEHIGEDELADPLHLAGSLVQLVAGTPYQEIGSHTFSHYYCLEPGQTEEALRADLSSARAIASSCGVELKSIVLPRNQWNPAYNVALRDCGFTCYRGPQPSWSHRPRPDGSSSHLQRAVRLAGTYAGLRPPPTTAWTDVAGEDGLCNVPASAFLRPYTKRSASFSSLQRTRLASGMRAAARSSRIFHLWWHPHNFADHRRENLDLLGSLLDEFDLLSGSEGFVSMSMGDVASACAAAGG
jgi:Polysaccharide deacetylase